jgi:hypothetical protein
MDKKNICTDYDSMGDYSRFPRKIKQKSPTLKERLIKLFKRKQK